MVFRGTTDPMGVFSGAARNTTVAATACGVRLNCADADALIGPCTCGKEATQSASLQLIEAETDMAPPALMW